MKFKEYADREMLAIGLADILAGDLESRLVTGESASFAVPGGTSPGPVFDALSGVRLDWSRVTVLPTDERWVPGDHERSNARLIRERLLTDCAAEAGFLPLYRDDMTPEEALGDISAAVAPHVPISVLVLGMGDDMHTASLFPGAPGLDEGLRGDSPVAVMRPDSQPDVRISLTAPVLDGALNKHLIIYGAAKREALERAQQLSAEEAPVRAVLTDITVHWAE